MRAYAKMYSNVMCSLFRRCHLIPYWRGVDILENIIYIMMMFEVNTLSGKNIE
jgi:hypothetical protein